MTISLNEIRVGVISLGCPKNLVDTEVMLGVLKENGASLTTHPDEADVLVVNTCAFIGPAKEESVNTILELASYKDEGKCKALIVTGCLSQRYQEELMREIPEIDAIMGTGDLDRVADVVWRALRQERTTSVSAPGFIHGAVTPRVMATPGHFAYVKIAEGCSHACSFCVIPSIRGRYRSRGIDDVVSEVGRLVTEGVREVILVAQDTTCYGVDLYERPALADLLRRLDQTGADWIRVLYTYPTSFTDELIKAFAVLDRVVKYVDLPLQHCNDQILKAMRRRGTQADLRRLISRLRSEVPGIALRSSFIVGFPGETDDQFRALLDFLEESEFDHAGIFRFSREEGTPAYDLPDQIADEVREERYQKAMELQQRISRRKNAERVGRVYPILVDGPSEETDLVFVGRTPFQAPEIDGVTYFANTSLARGTLAKVRITEAHDYDLVGEIVMTGEKP